MSSKINTIIHNTGQRRRPLTLCSYHIKRSGGLCVCVQCLHKFVHDKLLMNTLHSSSCVWGDTRCLFACFVSKHLIIHSHKKKQCWVKNVCFWTQLTLVAENFRLLCEMKKFTMDVEGKKIAMLLRYNYEGRGRNAYKWLPNWKHGMTSISEWAEKFCHAQKNEKSDFIRHTCMHL